MKCLVTGAAGFIGSHLCQRLLHAGHEVVGVDAFIPYYPRPLKEANLSRLRGDPAFTFHEIDLRLDPLEPLLDNVAVVFHLAAMAGLTRSVRAQREATTKRLVCATCAGLRNSGRFSAA